MLTSLEMHLSLVPVRAVAAWFFSGDDPERWLAELARCGLAEPETRLFVVSALQTSPARIAGVLVIPGKNREPSAQPGGVACGVVAERLFLPVDATLSPPISDLEARELCRDQITFFHPALGMRGFGNEDALQVWDLLEAPLPSAENWNLARPPGAEVARFHGIILNNPPTSADLFGEESRDIGSEKDEILPPAPDEPKDDAASRAGRGARKALARNINNLLRQLPHGKSRTWLNDLEDWANRQLQGVSAQLDRLRNKELHRLLHLLDSDPEAGLRHAIPMNDFAHRGRGPSGGRLMEHGLNFDPNRIGGGAADHWNIPRDLQAELTRRYREMANRELQLKRHRRAAYIYAELLGDLLSAATALRQGGHFREASILFEERLKNPLAAAQCLAEGGFLEDAIERYEKLGHWLEAADLYERLGAPEKAVVALRKVVSQRLATGDIVGAADLLEKRLNAIDEALQLLEKAWPRSRHATQCLTAQFALLGRCGRPEAALERLATLRREKLSGPYYKPLAELLTDLAGAFPDQRVRHDAADLARVLIAPMITDHWLPSAKASELVRLLYRLAPGDRLLVRDGNRYLAGRRGREPEVQAASARPDGTRGEPRVFKKLELPRQMEWVAVRIDGPWFFAAGVTARHLTLVRGTWEGEFQSVTWNCTATSVKQGFVCEPVNQPGNRCVILSVAGHEGLREQTFPPDLFISRGCRAGTPAWLSTELHPFTIADSNLWSMHISSGQAVLSCYGLGGGLLRTLDITSDLLTGASRSETSRLCLARMGQGAAVALGNRLLLPQGDGTLLRVELPGQARALVPTLANTRPGIIVLLENGAVLQWLGHEHLITLDNDASWSSAAWTPSGKLVAVSAKEICLLDVDARGVHGSKRVPWNGDPPLAVTSAGEPGRFAVFTAKGDVTIFALPG